MTGYKRSGAITKAPYYRRAMPGGRREIITDRQGIKKMMPGTYRTEGNWLRNQGVEVKNFDRPVDIDVNVTGGEFTAIAPSVQLINIDQGTGANQRIGRKIKITKVNFHGMIRATAYKALTGWENAEQSEVMVVVAVVLDTQTNGGGTPPNPGDPPVPATFNDVYQQSTAGAGVQFRNLNVGTRFRILKEWRVVLNETAVQVVGTVAKPYFESKIINMNKKTNIVVEFGADTSGGLANQRTNSIIVVSGCITGTVPEDCTLNVGAYGQSRLRFTDM